jgi:addiction module RelE/StbE family toxin
MAQINWTNQSLEDIQQIASYISNNSERYAQIFVDKVFEKVEILVDLPRVGRMVPEIELEYIRELIYGNYRIVYRIVNDNRIDILTIHHSARPLSKDSLFN